MTSNIFELFPFEQKNMEIVRFYKNKERVKSSALTEI